MVRHAATQVSGDDPQKPNPTNLHISTSSLVRQVCLYPTTIHNICYRKYPKRAILAPQMR